MKIFKICTLLFCFTLLTNFSFAQAPNEIKTAQDVIERSITAMGGKEYLSNIKTLYSEMSTEMDGRKVLWITKEMAPNKGAFQIVYNDRIVFENWYDGETGYEIVRGEKKKSDPEEFKSKKYRKHIFNDLDFIDPSLWTLELLGEEKVNKENCYKIRATSAGGEIKHLFFSKTSSLMIREDSISNTEKDRFTTVQFSDFKKFGDLLYYGTIKFGEGKEVKIGKVVTVKANEGVTDKDFNK